MSEKTKVITLRVPESLRDMANKLVKQEKKADSEAPSLNQRLADHLIKLTGWTPDDAATFKDAEPVVPPTNDRLVEETRIPAGDPIQRAAAEASEWFTQSIRTFGSWGMRQPTNSRWDVKAKDIELKGKTVVEIDDYLVAAGFVGEFSIRPHVRMTA